MTATHHYDLQSAQDHYHLKTGQWSRKH